MPNNTTSLTLEPHKLDTDGWHQRLAEHNALFRRFANPDGSVILTLDWRAAKTNLNSLYFHIRGSVLMVFGDLHEGVYIWNDRFNWNWLAGLNLDYFAEKCRAGPHGMGAKVWDRETAFASIWHLLNEQAREAEDYEETPDNHGVEAWVCKQLELDYFVRSSAAVQDYIRESCASQSTFYEMLHNHEKLFGDPCEMGDLGMTVCFETRLHLLSLKYALQRVQPEVWCPVYVDDAVGIDSSAICCSHDGNVPKIMPTGASHWIRVACPHWVKVLEEQHGKAAEDAPGGGGSGA